MLSVCRIAAVSLFLLSACQLQAYAQEDANPLIGEWEVISSVENGEAQQVLTGARVLFTETQMITTVMVGGQALDPSIIYDYEINTEFTPAHFDSIHNGGEEDRVDPEEGVAEENLHRSRGIVQFDSEDEISICKAFVGAVNRQETIAEGENISLLRLRRVN